MAERRPPFRSDPRSELDEIERSAPIPPVQFTARDIIDALAQSTAIRSEVLELRSRVSAIEDANAEGLATELQQSREKLAAYDTAAKKRAEDERAAELARQSKKTQDELDERSKREETRIKERREWIRSIVLLVLGGVVSLVGAWLLKR